MYIIEALLRLLLSLMVFTKILTVYNIFGTGNYQLLKKTDMRGVPDFLFVYQPDVFLIIHVN